MRSKLLIGTAALLAGMAVASAQNMPQGGGQQGHAAAPEKSAPPSAQPGQKGGQAQQNQDKGKAHQQGQAPAQRGQKDQTTGQGAQGQGEQGKAQRQPESKGQGESKGQTQGQSPQRDQSQQGQTQQRNQSAPQQSQGQDQRQPSQAQGQQGQSGASATLTTEQRTRIRETVISSGPKVSSVNFSLSVGTVVPRTVTVVAVPAIIVEVYPQYRGLMYFVVGDQIIIVDQSHKIVAVISV